MPPELKLGRCIHCLRYFAKDELTDDHVVPNSWYPPTVRRRDRPVAPSCLACNRKLGKIERAIGVRLGLCFGRDDPIAGYFAKSAARAVNPRVGANPKDVMHRYGLGKSIVNNWLVAEEISSASVIPGFERAPGSEDSEVQAIGLEKATLDAFGEKLIRGSSYVFSELYIEPGHDIVVMLQPRGKNPFLQLLDQFGRTLDLAPGIAIRRAGDDPVDPACAIFEFKFWNRFYIYGAVQQSNPNSGRSPI